MVYPYLEIKFRLKNTFIFVAKITRGNNDYDEDDKRKSF